MAKFLVIILNQLKNLKMKQICFALIACALMMGCKEGKEEKVIEKAFDLAPVKAAIAESNAHYGDAFVKGDASLIINCYTKDGSIMPAGAPVLVGAEGIGGFFNLASTAMGVKNVKLTTAEVMGGPEIVVETGTYELFGEGNKSLDNGKFVVAWKQEDGKWKMHRDIFTSSVPPPPPPPAAKK
jgi:ketosteroid isomerase-like protein